jgi:putative transposase
MVGRVTATHTSAYVLGISTRKVDDLMAALGGCSVSRSEVSRICVQLDEELAEFRDGPLDEPHPYVWVDATYEKVRQGGRIASQAAVWPQTRHWRSAAPGTS